MENITTEEKEKKLARKIQLVNLFNGTSYWNSGQHHSRYGIQNYLVRKGYILSKTSEYYVDRLKYFRLIRDFVEYKIGGKDCKIPKYSQTKYESIIQQNFQLFISFVTKNIKNYDT